MSNQDAMWKVRRRLVVATVLGWSFTTSIAPIKNSSVELVSIDPVRADESLTVTVGQEAPKAQVAPWIRPQDLAHPPVERPVGTGTEPQRAPASTMPAQMKAQLKGRIAFSRYWGNYGIFTMNPDGTQLTKLTPTLMPEGDPAISPDGHRIAFLKGHSVWTMDIDGTNRKELVRRGPSGRFPHRSLSWHPDGTKLLFAGRDGLYIVEADGNNPTLFIAEGTSGAWSPDGKTIAFSAPAGVSNAEIFVIDADAKDAGEARRLTFDAPHKPVRDFEPSWSPDGQQIVFNAAGNIQWNAGGLYTIDADGQNIRFLPGSNWVDSSPCFVGDNKHIIYAHHLPQGHVVYLFDSTQANPIHYALTDGVDSYQLSWGIAAPPTPKAPAAKAPAAKAPAAKAPAAKAATTTSPGQRVRPGTGDSSRAAPATTPSAPSSLSSKCIGVPSGDTLLVQFGGRTVTVKLYGIICPDPQQKYGAQAKRLTSQLALGKNVMIYVKGPSGTVAPTHAENSAGSKDGAGSSGKTAPVVGWAFVGKRCLNAVLVQNGLSDYDYNKAPGETKLQDLKQEALDKRLNIWSSLAQ